MLRTPRLLLILALLAVLATPGAVLAQEGSEAKTWPPPAEVKVKVNTKPAPVTTDQLRSGGPVGLGMLLGSRTGLTLKIQPARPHGITIDVGATPFSNSMSAALGYTFHVAPLRAPSGVSAQFYFGLGMRLRLLFFNQPDPNDATKTVVGVGTVLGARIPLGMSFLLADFPVELFVEVAPAVDFWQAFGVDVEGIGGARVFFGKKKQVENFVY
jgi:hypothetical protein